MEPNSINGGYLRYFMICGVFALIITPLVITPGSYFPFVTGKNLYFRACVEVTLLAWLIHRIIVVSPPRRSTPLLISLGVFSGIIALADWTGVDTDRSLWSSLERSEGLVTLVHLYMLFVMLPTVLDTRLLWHRYISGIVAVSALVAVHGLLQKAGWLEIRSDPMRVDANFGNPSFLAGYAVMHVFLALMIGMAPGISRGARWFFRTAVLLNVLVIYWTGTRGALLGMLGGLMFVLGIFLIKKSIDRHLLWLGGSALSLVLLVMGLEAIEIVRSPVPMDGTWPRLVEVMVEGQGTESRLLAWKVAWEGILERPIWGWGQENFLYLFDQFFDPRMAQYEPWLDRAHNAILDWLIAGGILGLLAYLAVGLTALFQLWRAHNLSATARVLLASLFVAYFIQVQFTFDHIASYLVLIIVLGYVDFNYQHHDNQHNPGKRVVDRQPTSTALRGILVIVCAGAFAVLFNTTVLRPAEVSRYALAAYTALDTDPMESIIQCKQGIDLDTPSNSDLRLLAGMAGYRLALLTAYTATAKSVRWQQYSLDQLRQQTVTKPDDFRGWYLLGALLHLQGAYEDAIQALQHAQMLSPKRQTALYELASTHMDRGALKEGIKIFKQAYELDPDNQQAHTLYREAVRRAGLPWVFPEH